jgi:uncharacterized protein YcgI (DUF1989 family)
MELPEIPKTWLVGLLMVCMVVLRALNYDTFVTACLSGIAFYILGQHIESTDPEKQQIQNDLNSYEAELTAIKNNLKNGMTVSVDNDGNISFKG